MERIPQKVEESKGKCEFYFDYFDNEIFKGDDEIELQIKYHESVEE